jgi:hypothetical protein
MSLLIPLQMLYSGMSGTQAEDIFVICHPHYNYTGVMIERDSLTEGNSTRLFVSVLRLIVRKLFTLMCRSYWFK